MLARAPAEDAKRVEGLANDFAAMLPELKFSPAEILSFLMGYRQSPREANENVEIWMTRVREQRKEANNYI